MFIRSHRPLRPRTTLPALTVLTTLALLLCLATPSARAQSPTATTLAITSSGSPATTVKEGTAVTLTATVANGGAPITPGQVNFCVASAKLCTDINLIGTAQLIANGTATISFTPGPGTHTYQAFFLGTHAAAASSSAPSTLVVTPFYPTTTAITSSGSPANYTLTATVTGTEGTVAPTGNISFLDTSNANYLLGTAPLLPSAGTPGVSFVNSANVETGNNNQTVVLADFNGDGKLDMAVLGYSNDGLYGPSIYILLGNGDGTFTRAPGIPILPHGSGVMAVADFNGDGKLDIATTFGASTGDGIQIFWGNGDGTFTAGQAIALPSVDFIAAGDFNGDGIPDLAVTNGSDSVTILLGNGDGTFTLKSTMPAGESPVNIAVGDFNHDGKADLAVLDDPGPDVASGSVTILLSNGDGTFTASPESPVTGTNPLSIVAADFNGDGFLDLAVANVPNPIGQRVLGSITILLGNGDGTFTPAAGSPATGSEARSIAVGDFNGDGKADLVIPGFTLDKIDTGIVSVLLGNGDGTFAPALNQTMGVDPDFTAAGDFNGDGLSDIATAMETTPYAIMGTGSVDVLLSQSGPQSATATVTGVSPVGTGTHQVDASYPGDGAYRGSISPAIGLIAAPEITTLALAAAPPATAYGQPIALTATISPSTAQNHNATGTVTFTNGTTQLGTAPVSSGAASITTSVLPAGTDTVTAAYSGDTNFTASTATAAESVTGLASATGLTVTPNPATVGQAVTLTAAVTGAGTVPTGTVTFYDGTVSLGQFPLDPTGHAHLTTPAFTIGIHTLTAAYTGDAGYYSSASAPVVLTVNALPSATTLTVSPNPAGTGQTVSLTAAVSGAGPTPTGPITFSDGATMLGQAALDATGHATLTTSTLALGAHSLTASYPGDAVYSPSASAPVTETLVTPSFTLAVSPNAFTVSQGASATATVTITSLGNFNQPLQLSCSGLPTNATCTFAPSTLTPGPNPVTSTLTLNTRLTSLDLASTSTNPSNLRPTPARLTFAALLPGSFLALFGLFTLRRRNPAHSSQPGAPYLDSEMWAFALRANRSRPRRVPHSSQPHRDERDARPSLFHLRLLLALFALALTTAITGCGQNVRFIAAPLGNYTIQVTATPTAQPTPTHSAPITLTIQ